MQFTRFPILITMNIEISHLVLSHRWYHTRPVIIINYAWRFQQSANLIGVKVPSKDRNMSHIIESVRPWNGFIETTSRIKICRRILAEGGLWRSSFEVQGPQKAAVMMTDLLETVLVTEILMTIHGYCSSSSVTVCHPHRFCLRQALR